MAHTARHGRRAEQCGGQVCKDAPERLTKDTIRLKQKKAESDKKIQRMNKTLTAALALLLSTAGNAQMRENMVLIEEFSNTGCGPCAGYSPVLDSAVSYRLGDVISIKYHGSYPSPHDIFYLNLKETMQKRLDYYNVTGVPTTVVDGMETNARSAEDIYKDIDEYLNTKRDFKISLEASVKDGLFEATANVIPLKDVVNPNIRLFVCAIEEYYENASVFQNGETHVRNILRQMIPSADGHSFGAELKQGSEYTLDAEWTMENIGNEKQIGAVAFLQDMATKQVLATAYVPRPAAGSDRACVMNVENTPDLICTPLYYGNVTLRNEGANDITSMNVNVEINGTVKTYPWTGTLKYLEKTNVRFEDFNDFTLNDGGYNQAKVWLSGINGTTAESNRFGLTLKNAVTAENAAQLRIYTDNKPEETTWRVINSAGDMVDSGGPYDAARKMYTHDLKLPADDCYTIEFADAGGDGIAGSKYGNGYYQLFQVNAEGKKKNISQGDYRESLFLLNFSLKDAAATGIDNASAAKAGGKCLVYNAAGVKVMDAGTAEVETKLRAAGQKGVFVVKPETGRAYKITVE